jgi:hypothetical protein
MNCAGLRARKAQVGPRDKRIDSMSVLNQTRGWAPRTPGGAQTPVRASEEGAEIDVIKSKLYLEGRT